MARDPLHARVCYRAVRCPHQALLFPALICAGLTLCAVSVHFLLIGFVGSNVVRAETLIVFGEMVKKRWLISRHCHGISLEAEEGTRC